MVYPIPSRSQIDVWLREINSRVPGYQKDNVYVASYTRLNKALTSLLEDNAMLKDEVASLSREIETLKDAAKRYVAIDNNTLEVSPKKKTKGAE